MTACADPHDKVYGLLGLMLPDQRVTVDYEKSIDQLCMDVTLIAIQSWCFNRFLKAEAANIHDYSELPRLAIWMEVTQPLQYNHFVFLRGIWHRHRLGRFRGHACPITAMGFEKAAMTGCKADQFWFDFQGTRYFLSCTRIRMEYEIKGLLSEDWGKYVPREHADETS